MSFSRREMIKVSAACAVAGKSTAAQAGTSTSLSESNQTTAQVPSHLKGLAKLYEKDPLAASAKWFREAKFGLFVHYGIYSLMEPGE